MFAVECRRYLPVLFRDITIRGRHALRVPHDTDAQYYSTHIHRAIRTQNATQRPENRGEYGTTLELPQLSAETNLIKLLANQREHVIQIIF